MDSKNNLGKKADCPVEIILKKAKEAKIGLSLLNENIKNKNLQALADGIKADVFNILKANELDIKLAEKNNLSSALIDRLLLNSQRINGMVEAIEDIIKLPDPIGDVIDSFEHKNKMRIQKVRVPIGIITVIYESRPNVTSDVAALCIKAGKRVILRGGKETINTNIAIYNAMMAGINLLPEDIRLPDGAIQFLHDTDRSLVKKLVQSDNIIDLVIPRGGYELSQAISKLATIPVIKHDKGLCHIYVEKSADLKKALNIIINAKCQRPGVCNALETLLIDKKMADKFLPIVIKKLIESDCEVRLDDYSYDFVLKNKNNNININKIKKADKSDWDTEYLDLILSIKIVDGVIEAVSHIRDYGSNHSDAIIAEDKNTQLLFAKQVDSACVYINASTRFTDGGEFGMGAEIGISTNKLHARGPMGLQELSTYHYVLTGNGQVRV